MVLVNENYLKLQKNYLFSDIARKTRDFIAANPKAPIIKLGIGDTTLPLPPTVIKAFHDAVDEMADATTFRGYGPEQGYAFLRELIVEHEYRTRGVSIQIDEIFISDGSKCDTGNILDIFGRNTIAISDPSYPVYVDTNVMAGNAGDPTNHGQYSNIVYLPCNESNLFKPEIPAFHVDLIYLCSPNNPTGTALNYGEMKSWVDYALRENAIILFDAAYERFITEDQIPHSIYEIPEAQKVAIEFRSFSKTAGFTGTRCAFTVVPKDLLGFDSNQKNFSIHALWNRRHCTKFNGVSYPVQKAIAAIYSQKGSEEILRNIQYYQHNAQIIRDGLNKAGLEFYGGINSPYIWVKSPQDKSSWELFDLFLHQMHIIGTPGSGFGPNGEGYFRLTAFGSQKDTQCAIERIQNYDFNA
ncbi:LL-diaminopimelate aminotransferase [Candidatus Lokiarchaeum ossiferum]|uniref:LL-diaminopimelate aminotransferase n=1 Tax=Candidatus Lokiarchaeum ossiferum TaxID=2951803 RepID=A0ABY6HP80_9ARCH|nr:LL-diaminopimelate aminotransferase [Candidatus Lokiarchaeum sp. B-35]